MTQNLAPSFCENVTGLKDFLRLSRTLVDDTITQNLNNLVLPPRFDPESTSHQEKKVMRTPIDKSSCSTLVDTIFENWDARSSTIDYCLSTIQPEPNIIHTATREELQRRRLDPYFAQQVYVEPILKRVCDQENGTEAIIRDRTWRIVRGRCEDINNMERDWQTAFRNWKRNRAT